MDLAQFSGLTLERQLAYLDEALAEGQRGQLLEMAAALRDGAPISWLVGRLRQLGWFGQPANQQSFGHFLTGLEDTAIQASLKGAAGDPGVAAAVFEALRSIELAKLSAMCLLDRFLKHNDPDRRDRYLGQLVEECCNLLEGGQCPSLEQLVRLPARALHRLQQAAQQGGVTDRFEQARQQLARQVISILEAAPKGVSQSNAEELLSRRVYTDPGHFLIELLQNADDAEARTFRVEFSTQHVLVWHDGLPFDARDLVGVTSIGQTTKRKQQIGFFGVGFKSVYEVTDRPRIYSDVYQFEIADVSIPRYLHQRPEWLPAEGTALILPLRAPDDPDRSPEGLFQRARRLDPCVLLTLRELRCIEFRLADESYRLERFDQGELSAIQVGSTRRVFALERRRYSYQGAREQNRPDNTEVCVGLLLSEPGRPLAFPPKAATVYSYLPTDEHTGLKFFIQGHFDVPVDRERISHESDWNRWILAQVPELVEALARRFGAGILEVLPLAEEMLSPLFSGLPEAIYARLQEVELLPGHDGQLHPPRRVVLARPEVVSLFADHSQRYCFLSPEVGERPRKLAQALGCREFGVEELVSDLEQGLLPPAVDWPHFYDLLLEELERLERQQSGLDEWVTRLQACLLVPDRDQQLRPLNQVARAEGHLAELYAGLVPLVWPELVGRPRVETLFDRLGMRRLDGERLLDDLARDVTPFLARFEALYAYLTEAPWTVTERACLLPIFPAAGGGFGRLARNPDDVEGLFRADPPEVVELLEARRYLAHHFADHPVLETIRVESTGLSEVLLAMARGHWQPDDGQKTKLLELLLSHGQRLTAANLGLLFELPLFANQAGAFCRLSGLYRPASPALVELLGPQFFLDAEALSGQVAARLNLLPYLEQATPELLVAWLAERKLPPTQTLAYLASQVQSLNQDVLERLLSLPLFDGLPLGRRPQAGVLCRCQPGFEQVFACLGVNVLEPEQSQLVAPLLEAAGWTPLGLEELVSTLADRQPQLEQLEVVQSALLAHRQALLERFSTSLLGSLAVWRNAADQVVSASRLVDDPELLELLPDPGATPVEQLLLPALDDYQTCKPQVYLNDWLRRKARLGQPLEAQPVPLNELEGVMAVARRLPEGQLLVVTADQRLGDQLLPMAAPTTIALLPDQDFLHPDWPPELAPGARRLPAYAVLARLIDLEQPEVRQRFYGWLLECQGEIFTDPEARRSLAEDKLFLSSGGRWLAAQELVLDPDFPDLDIDWLPHPEIPAECLELLRRQLDVGSPDPEEVLQAHLLPAYHARLKQGREGPLLDYIIKLTTRLPARLLRALVGSLPVRDISGLVQPFEALVLPPAHCPPLVTIPCPDGYQERREFFEKLGMARVPSRHHLEAALRVTGLADCAALVTSLAAWLREHDLSELRTLARDTAWLFDGQAKKRYPTELLSPHPEVEALAGTFPELYPHPDLSALLDARLLEWLGLRTAKDLDFPDVVRNLLERVKAGQAVGQHLYRFLEEGLTRGSIDPDQLHRALADQAFIYCDDGRYRRPDQVFAVPVFRWFGDRRGCWESARDFPRLCQLFSISDRLEPSAILSFLEEIARAPAASLEEEPALPRMLRACYAELVATGSTVPTAWPVILARGPRLVASHRPGLVRSDTPTLEALFAEVGELLVAEPGGPQDAVALDIFYARQGIRRLRDAYRVSVDGRSGRDVTEQAAAELLAVRSLLRALLEVAPRVRLQRSGLENGGWLYKERLGGLAGTATIRLIDGLQVVYQLDGVGSVSRRAAAAYDPGKPALLLDLASAREPGQAAVGLAEALVSCLYEGPGQEQLVDILELLIPLGRAEAMHAYLDRRHFPASASARRPVDLLLERLGEILDYRLHERLAQVFPQLAEADFGRWRGDGLAPRLEPLLGQPSWPRQVATRLLDELGLKAPDGELISALAEMLSQPQLSLPSQLAPSQPAPAPVAPSQEEPEMVPAPVADEPERPAFWDRLLSWVPAARQPEEAGPIQFPDNSLVPMPGVLPQLGLRPEHMRQMLENPPETRLTHHPARLSSPHIYGLQGVGGRFDPADQTYLPVALKLGKGTGVSTRPLTLRGRVLPGLSLLPVPLYSRMKERPRVFGRAGSVRISGPDPLGQWYLEVKGEQSVGVRYEVELTEIPLLEGRGLPSHDPALVEPTMPLAELPQRAQRWIEQTGQAGLAPWRAAQLACEFVRTHYLYDESYSLRPEVEKARRRLRSGQGNHHLQLLHASADEVHLGRGICYELNLMVAELLRHLELPSLVATCWVFDQGALDRADHLVCLALLDSSSGPCLVPLDACADRRGPRHILGHDPEPSPWGSDLASERERLEQELEVLARVYHLVFDRHPPSPAAARGELAQKLGETALGLMLAAVRGDLKKLDQVPEGVADLVVRGWLKVLEQPEYSVVPND
ncbi:MAG: sacsin N-terminal ATP-binding-like domain-containing protein [Vulcanimicrobiota bacterium]